MQNRPLRDIHILWKMGQALRGVDRVFDASARTAAYIAAGICDADIHRLDEEALSVEQIRRRLFILNDDQGPIL